MVSTEFYWDKFEGSENSVNSLPLTDTKAFLEIKIVALKH